MNNNKYDPHHIDTNRCVENIGNRFNLILVAGARVRELRRGHAKKVLENNSPSITALREIEQGHIGKDYLKKI